MASVPVVLSSPHQAIDADNFSVCVDSPPSNPLKPLVMSLDVARSLLPTRWWLHSGRCRIHSGCDVGSHSARKAALSPRSTSRLRARGSSKCRGGALRGATRAQVAYKVPLQKPPHSHTDLTAQLWVKKTLWCLRRCCHPALGHLHVTDPERLAGRLGVGGVSLKHTRCISRTSAGSRGRGSRGPTVDGRASVDSFSEKKDFGVFVFVFASNGQGLCLPPPFIQVAPAHCWFNLFPQSPFPIPAFCSGPRLRPGLLSPPN